MTLEELLNQTFLGKHIEGTDRETGRAFSGVVRGVEALSVYESESAYLELYLNNVSYVTLSQYCEFSTAIVTATTTPASG